MTPGDRLVADMQQALGADSVLAEPELTARYETDWMGRRFGAARVVVRPASTEEVRSVVERCLSAGAPVVVQGGNTGLVAGGVPRGGEVVISTERLSWVAEPDPVSASGNWTTVTFVSATVGFAVAEGQSGPGPRATGALVETTDAGQHWSAVPLTAG